MFCHYRPAVSVTVLLLFLLIGQLNYLNMCEKCWLCLARKTY